MWKLRYCLRFQADKDKKMEESLSARYHRQIILKEFGTEGQEKLLRASVLVIGAGGLGCPTLLYLAAAGVGRIGIVDDGLVELSNLHRQVLYRTNDIGKKKVDCAKEVLQYMNPTIAVDTYALYLSSSHALNIIDDYDIVIDGTDNFQSRYMINDACTIMGKPLIYGAISRYEGQVAIFTNGVNYRDIFPDLPKDGEITNCNEAGVLNILPGIIGNFLANECIKLITGLGETLQGKLFTYNALRNQTYIIDIDPVAGDKHTGPVNEDEFRKIDYKHLCSADKSEVSEISLSQLKKIYKGSEIDMVDVREDFELPKISTYQHLKIPLSILDKQFESIQKDTVIFVCQSGKRSLMAAQLYQKMIGPNKKNVYSFNGGVGALEPTT